MAEQEEGHRGKMFKGEPASSSGYEQPLRPRGGFRRDELKTVPDKVVGALSVTEYSKCKPVELLTNYVALAPMKDKAIYSYRVDFEPSIENRRVRAKVFRAASDQVLKSALYDSGNECRSGKKLAQDETKVPVQLEGDADKYEVIFKATGIASWGQELFRVYNIQLKKFLTLLGFYQPQPGLYVHPTNLAETIIAEQRLRDQNQQAVRHELKMLRGYRTSVNSHDGNRMLVNFELGHKLLQSKTVHQLMADIATSSRGGGGLKERIRSELTGKIVIPNYTGGKDQIYRIEDVDFDSKPTDSFTLNTGEEITFLEYYARKKIEIHDHNQALLVVVPNNRRRREEAEARGDGGRVTKLIPELCNIAGLTSQQVNDTNVKMTLIRSTQVTPDNHVKIIQRFLNEFHSNEKILSDLRDWGYSYGTQLEKVRAHVLEVPRVAFGRVATQTADKWHTVKPDTADFNVNGLAKVPNIPNVAIVIAQRENQQFGLLIRDRLKNGFERAGLAVNFSDSNQVRLFEIRDESPASYIKQLRDLPANVLCIVIMSSPQKASYDAIKKVATVERGMITQVVTRRLLADERKFAGAVLKIAIQVAAKVTGEPWWIHIPLGDTMVCGYDTYHDTANRGRSYGAFLASMNARFSRWFSKVDAHDRLDELSSQISRNVVEAVGKYKEANDNKLPRRIYIYRDGVGEGQIADVYNIELKRIHEEVKKISPNILLTIVLVNKRIGARFYQQSPRGFTNVSPGTVVDKVVTRDGRFDFYLVSQSTRNGTLTPTYYNIIGPDDSGLTAELHQTLAYRFCLLYYNWSGGVRVPAPCQYAHKLALLCGENVHAPPNARLEKTLHFL